MFNYGEGIDYDLNKYASRSAIADAVLAYYDNLGSFRSISRGLDIKASEKKLGKLQGDTVEFRFYMCHDINGNSCGRTTKDLVSSDQVIARVYEDYYGSWGAVVG